VDLCQVFPGRWGLQEEERARGLGRGGSTSVGGGGGGGCWCRVRDVHVRGGGHRAREESGSARDGMAAKIPKTLLLLAREVEEKEEKDIPNKDGAFQHPVVIFGWDRAHDDFDVP